jgi:hypothetical protein
MIIEKTLMFIRLVVDVAHWLIVKRCDSIGQPHMHIIQRSNKIAV